MGPESESMGTLYWDGVPIMAGVINEITVPGDALTPEAMTMLQPMECVEFTLHFKVPKNWRCRSRKRFIKLMMSEGISRNYAEWLAGFVRGWMPYGEAWRTYRLYGFWAVRV